MADFLADVLAGEAALVSQLKPLFPVPIIVLPPIDGPRDLLTLTPRRHNLALARLDENLGAAKIELTPDDLCMIDNAAAQIRIEGARYPEKLEQLTGRQPSETTGG